VPPWVRANSGLEHLYFPRLGGTFRAYAAIYSGSRSVDPGLA
jgi:hypothetical protein